MSRIEVTLPKWGMTMREAVISQWLRSPGDRVSEGDVLCEVETDKVDAEVEAPSGGVLVEIIAGQGDTVEVGAVIALLEAG